MKLANKGLLVIFVPLFFQISLAVILVFLLFQAQEEVAQHAHADLIYEGCNNVVKSLAAAPTIESLFSGGQLEALDIGTIRAQIQQFNDRVDVVAHAVAEEQQTDNSELVRPLMVSARSCSELMANTYGALKQGGTTRLGAYNGMEHEGFSRGTGLFLALDAICKHELAVEENARIMHRGRSMALRQWLLAWALIGVGISISAAIACIIHIRSRIKTLTENTRRFALREPLLPSTPGSDELETLDHIFHALDASIEEVAQRERALIDNAAELVCSVDRNANFERVNSFSLRLLNRSAESLISTPVLEVVTKDDYLKAHDQFDLASGHEGDHSFELRLQPLGKQPVDTSWTTFWSERDGSLFCVVSDVTERNSIERLKEDFVAMISHDLRTPLMSLSIDISLLMRAGQTLPTEALDGLQEAEITVQRLIRFVNDLLDFEKLQAGKMQFVKEPINVDSLIVNAAADLFDLAKPLNIEVSVVSNCLRTVHGDREKLGQLVTNILTNALQRSPAGSSISIGALVEGENIEVEIVDQGEGLSTEAASNIFAPFSQTLSGSERETGLELAICKLIVEAHDGQIGVKPAADQQTAFWFSIPNPPIADDA